MPKGLRLKMTRAEQAEHKLRKARRAAKNVTFRHHLTQDTDFDLDSHKSKRRDERVLDPGPSSSRYDARGVPVAEDSFQEKLWDALHDDDQLDAVEARLNEYAHVPRRWRGVSSQGNAIPGLDDSPELMNDDEYAEWVRVGIWRRRNAAAHHEQQRQEAARAAAKAEATRNLKAKEDARRREREERERRKRVDAREAYERRWVELHKSKSNTADLGFGDVPWPVRGVARDHSHLTAEAVSAFLFCTEEEGVGDAERARLRKEELRGTMLRFHPDKFEGRVIPQVKSEEKAAVREGANAVTRAVREMMEEK